MMSCLLWKSVTFLSLVWAVGGQLSGDLRLVDNSRRTGGSSGRLEVYYAGLWGTVCENSFSPNDARVACRQLGFSSYTQYGTVGRLSFFQASSSTRTWLDNLRCSGTESRLINCPRNIIGSSFCSHSQDIALICVGSTGSSSGDLRLVGNSGQTGGSSGRLEVYYSGQWGTVCDDSFGSSDARVACRQLGYSTSSTPRYGTVGELGFSQPSSSTRTWLDNLRCSGFESRLINCPANTIGIEDCSHSEDIALSCTGSFTYSIPSVSIGIGVTVPIVIIFVVVVLVCVLIGRKRRLARIQLRTPVVNSAASTSVVVTGSNTQSTAYPMQQSMDQKPQYSNQPPPQHVYAPQPVAAYPTGQQYADPQYHPQQPPAGYTQQPPAPYTQQPPAPYTQQPPAPYAQQPPAPYTPQQPPAAYPAPGEQQPPAVQYPTGQPPPAQYPTGQLSGGEAPPAYPD